VDWQHPALQSRYRGWSGGPAADHLHNWFDATGDGAVYPADGAGHGTHVMGTMVGQDGIGVAPGARWMAAKAFDSRGFALNSWLHSAFQFMLAPGGDPAYTPDIVNNSWGNPNGRLDEFKNDIAVLRAAGILVIFSNGNSGPRAETVGSPASLPGAIGVGATDSEDEVAYFSSRGPSPYNKEIRPTLSGPGVDVISSFPGGGYLSYQGTSMAAPHVAGSAALVLSAKPSLSIDATLFVLTSTAAALSATIPNNDSGWGRVDAYAAVLSVLDTGVLNGSVLDRSQPISGALVVAYDNASGLQSTALSDAFGSYSIRAPAGIYTVTASAFGYAPATSGPKLVVTNNATSVNLDLAYLPSGSVRGVVRDAVSGAYITATVRALGTPKLSISNNNCLPCRYALDLPTGDYTLEARAVGYLVQSQTVSVSDGVLTDLDFSLTPVQRVALVDSGAFYYGSVASYYRSALDALTIAYDEFRVKHVLADTPTITQLLKYDTVIWSAPFDAPSLVGASDVMSRYLAAGRNLLLTGQDVAFYDGGGFFGYQPYFSRLGVLYNNDDADSDVVIGAPEGPLAGKVITIAGGDGANNQVFPDVVTLSRPDIAHTIGNYALSGSPPGSVSGAGAYASKCVPYRSAFFSFGLEGIDMLADRVDVISRTLSAFVTPKPAFGVELLSRDTHLTGAAIGSRGTAVTHVMRLRNVGDGGATQTFSLAASGNAWPSTLSANSLTLAPCASTMVTLTVNIPADAGWDARDVVKITAAIAGAPGYEASVSFTSKTPAGILLVDDDRFDNREQDYIDALAAHGNTADRWDAQWQIGPTYTPPITVLRQYPIVVWYNGYDWFDPIKPAEERTLEQYLAGGGRLFFTSQAALDYTGLSSLVRNYLGVAAIDFNDVTSNVVGMPGTPLGDGRFGGSMLPFPYNWNLSAAVQPTRDTYVVVRGDSSQPFGLARTNLQTQTSNTPSIGWRTIFMPFAFETLPDASRRDLMNRIIGWLTPLGQTSLTSDRDSGSVQSGDIVNYTLVLRTDDVISPSLSASHPVSVSIDVADELDVVSSSLPNTSLRHAGDWLGNMRAGETLTWTFSARVAGGLTSGAPVTATAKIAMNDAGLRFTRDAVLHVGAPVLTAALEMQPNQPAWGSTVTFTLHAKNTGAFDAGDAKITAVVPTSMTLLASSVTATGGFAGAENNIVVWRGALAPGAEVVLRYAATLPQLTAAAPGVFFPSAQIDDGMGGFRQAAVWIRPSTTVLHYPLMSR
jgi:uncharacterized repeat protein (TIGR01451 family)